MVTNSTTSIGRGDEEEGDSQGQADAWSIALAFVSTMAIRAACKLRIPDILLTTHHEAAGEEMEGNGAAAMASPTHLSLAQIAARLPTPSDPASPSPNLDYLSRLMAFLSSKGVFSAMLFLDVNGDREWRYGPTPISKWFSWENHPFSLAPYLTFLESNAVQASWAALPDSIVEGRVPFERAHGMGVWSFATQNPGFSQLFNSAMASFSEGFVQVFLSAYTGLDGVNTLVDVGGGLGNTLSKIIEKHPSTKGINYDLPHVIRSAPPAAGVSHVGGDMFESIPTGDAIFMKSILHDWNDVRCVHILNNCRKALIPNGKIIIIEIILDYLQNDPFGEAMLAMDLILMNLGGKERTHKQWTSLLRQGGFSIISIVKMNSLWSIIEAYCE